MTNAAESTMDSPYLGGFDNSERPYRVASTVNTLICMQSSNTVLLRTGYRNAFGFPRISEKITPFST